MSLNTASFDDVKGFTNNKNEIIIDVREPKELQDTGVIPSSINIPLATVEEIFKNMSNEEFNAKFGRPKPSKDDSITLSCRSGNRSAKAQDFLRGLGYVNVKNYTGGWTDWATHL